MFRIGDYRKFSGLDKNYFMWFAIYIAIGLILSFTIPFPISLLVYIAIILILQTYRIKKLQHYYLTSTSDSSTRNTKNKGLRGFIHSISNSLFNDPYSLGSEPLRFVCMNCRTQHNERRCPNCGSGAVKLE
ncbi:hypothetical protein [Candidatus Nitrosocosmicus franklandus]|uniref:Uncharacterized protein n=1 Tax=Candidatus Nitrosocosmicus franklandianus TaxID=1798806 RepID=A0A484I8V3_9ARCH|nr:hypothetical protein [Candidatus Nitrosocosmicus franklandus]VFJ13546.1 conserved protein of unknown function [Candidatus Nitrosocosmicus franklandus]